MKRVVRGTIISWLCAAVIAGTVFQTSVLSNAAEYSDLLIENDTEIIEIIEDEEEAAVDSSEEDSASEAASESSEEKDILVEDASGEASSEDAATGEASFDADNKCGANATWKYDSKSKKLTISGTGAMYDYSLESPAPWQQYASAIYEINVGNGITNIGKYAFYKVGRNDSEYLRGLKSLKLASSVKSIGDHAFESARTDSDLKQFVIPDSVTTLGTAAFKNILLHSSFNGDKRMGTELVISSSVKTIPQDCFNGCSVYAISFPKGLERIEDGAFDQITCCNELSFPATLKYIGKKAFGSPTNVGKGFHIITFNGNMPTMEDTAFAGKSAYIYYPSDNATYTKTAIDKARKVFVASTWRPIGYKGNNKAGDNITWSLKSGGKNSSAGYILELVGYGPMYDYSMDNLPDWYTVKESVDRIIIDSRITSIGDYAFSSFGNVNNVDYKKYPLVLPKKLTKIGDHAFAGDSIPLATLPESVEYIGDAALGNMRQFTSNKFPTGVKHIGAEVFKNKEAGLVISDWGSIEYIGDSAFDHTKGMTIPASFPSTLKHIGKKAFESSSFSGTLVIPDSVKEIGERAFYGDSQLKGDVKLLGVTSLEWDIFYGTSVTSLTFGEGLSSVKKPDVSYVQFSKSVTKVTFNNKYFDDMKAVLRNMNLNQVMTTVYYPIGKGWPGSFDYKYLTFVSCGKCEVTFVAPDGSKTVKKVTPGEKVTAPTDIKLDKGVEIIGWFKSDEIDQSKKWDFSKAVQDSMCLYAKTNKDNCEVTFYMPQREVDIPYIEDYAKTVKKVTYGSKAAAPELTIKGYEVKGWYTDKNFTKVFDLTQSIKDKTVLYSKVGKESVFNFETAGSKLSCEREVHLTYNGYSQYYEPVIKVDRGNGFITLKEGTDYSLSYEGKKGFFEAGKYTITVKGINSYTGQIVITEIIDALDLSKSSDVSYKKEVTYKYNGQVQKYKPDIKVLLVNLNVYLKENQDYTVEYVENEKGAFVEPGTYTIKVHGKGNYQGTLVIKEKIVADKPADKPVTDCKPISKATISGVKNVSYNGQYQKMNKLVVKHSGKVLEEGKNYKVSYSDNLNAGTARITVTGLTSGGFTGTKEVTFKIKPLSIAKYKVTGIDSKYAKTYTGKAITISGIGVTASSGDTLKSSDYTCEYKNNTNAGTATIIIRGAGNYSGSITRTFKIAAAPLTEDAVSSGAVKVELPKSATYTKSKTVPEPAIYYKNVLLTKNRDYKLVYTNNSAVNDGSGNKVPTVKISGLKNYKGTITRTFVIKASSLANCTVTAKNVKYKKAKGNFKASVVIKDSNGVKLVANKDYDAKNIKYTYAASGKEVAKDAIVPVGTEIKATISGLGNYASGKTVTCKYQVVK